ncbi:TetR/AcrR family transcriptional regulator [Desulfofustis limnaeus]|jgi:TetR/AcrR family fatty acid metabolism transcriptional regulator|uniref:Fatty acid metabolism regulator protein n=1 Tax=Desulfofustis limnaeus TaxID=2740163 RepID=A0ABM7W8I5_9BACT|nr:TetR/AcrR family transcriptional regulator [Desulfofustis limnaeus]MDX9894214.1 TetR/AcrR family transcriptional regulator [Desulfofustis sp.]BDD87298.1 fatty acid metabolism regulator protein [Desulfofustis limnaeus]
MKSLEKHNKILTSATKVFAKKGFFNARISDIAKEAKVADGTIYLYFNNKFDILISVLEEEIGKIIEQIQKSIEKETDPQKMLTIFVQKHLATMKQNRNLAEVIHIELRQSDKLVKEYRNKTFKQYINVISHIIQRGQEQNVYRKDIKPGIAKRAFFGALDEVSRVWAESTGSTYSLEETTEQILALFLNGMLEKKA